MSMNRIADLVINTGIIYLICGFNNIPDYVTITTCIIVFFCTLVMYTLSGIYRSWQVFAIGREIPPIIIDNSVIAVVVYALIRYSGSTTNYHVAVYWLALSIPIVLLSHGTINAVLIIKKNNRYFSSKVVIYGISSASIRLIHWIKYNPWSNSDLIGIFSDDLSIDSIYDIPVIGGQDTIPSYIKKHNIDVVYMALSSFDNQNIHNLLYKLYDTACSIQFVADLSSVNYFQRLSIKFIGDLPVMSVIENPLSRIKTILKRFEDIVLSSILILLSSPLMIFATIGIILTTKESIIFKQWRYGQYGKQIKIWKFRTMNVSEDGFLYKQVTDNDNRVTKFGSLLRKTSIDELPQLFNVFLGSISLVGPRPHAIHMVDNYRKWVTGSMLRHIIKPGITGLAQIHATRDAVESVNQVQERILYDLDYIRRWSFMLDLKIIILTAINVVKRSFTNI